MNPQTAMNETPRSSDQGVILQLTHHLLEARSLARSIQMDLDKIDGNLGEIDGEVSKLRDLIQEAILKLTVATSA